MPTSIDWALGTFYNGEGALTISSSTGTVYTINKNPTSTAIVDFGTPSHAAVANWGSPTTPNYVKFAYTGTSNVDCFYVHDSSNMCFYGGEFTSGNYGGASIRYRGAGTNIHMWDFYSSMSGSHGIQIQPANPSDGSAETIDGCHFRGEVTKFCYNPANDPHKDKGSGLHGCLWQDTSHGTISSSSIALYAHDSLPPGAVSAGQTWPQGGGGSGIEIGTVGDSTSTNTFYILAENLLFTPWHSGAVNPGTDTTSSAQTGGNAVNHWGSKPLNGHVFEWVEGNNLTGAVTHGAGGSWFPGSPAIHVKHGRHSNVNQYTGGANISVPYDTTHGINYDADGMG